ncbi:MAG: hydantoinase B/oxoprolinase family protein [Phenylobacterium sp.]|uniref:hydantoinase B/oxoprolinase family protein n=1 Tax=Phenylobacterium sp. TaxID=1871053 RepID=UPI002734581B|nr:hydantoinase B/oxoprolinase family protein [Phenylobacterium sp.]MDP3749553.1 hydantoinase B/oxoprolinase family protein [Phenylobacterium sp.]
MSGLAEVRDPARLGILANRVDGVVRKMANTLLRTGRSGVLNRARDFSCCIVTADGHLLSSADSLPIHVLSGPDLMAEAMVRFQPDLAPGDAFLNNSAYHGCSHPADHTLLAPVFDGMGRHRYTVLVKAHQADIGNSTPTTYFAAARDVYEEGALIFPSVQVQRDYEDIADFIRMCEARIRVPEQWRGDYAAMVGSARIGERELKALGEEIGWDELAAFCGSWFEYSERRMAAALRRLPNAVASRVSIHDPFPGTPSDGVPVRVIVRVQPEAGSIEVDLTDNLDCLPCGLNLSEACARTSAMLGVFNSIDGDVPKNAGAFRRISVRLRENCVVGIPRHPHSCSAATTNLADRVANCVQAALAEIGDGIGMAEYGAPIPATSPVISGVDPRNGKAYVNQMFLGGTSAPGRPGADAWLTGLHVGNAGLGFIDSVELSELYHPLHVAHRRLVRDSEGAGRFCGAPSLSVEYGPVGGWMDIAYVSDGNLNPAQGVRGGGVGGPADQWIRHADGTLERLPQAAQVRVQPGEFVIATCNGGGGYGPPRERDRQAVRRDLEAGLLSSERAAAVYGFET